MKKIALTSLVTLTLCALSYAGTDSKEMKSVAAPTPCPINWTGFYLGLHAGYGWGQGDMTADPLPSATQFVNLAPTTFDPDRDGFVGGVQLGYNHQSGIWVFGLEADFSGTSLDSSTTLSPIIQNDGTPFPGAGNHLSMHQDIDWMGTVRGRIGFTPTCRLLLYATGGLAYGDVSFSGDTEFRPVGTVNYPASSSETKVGWTVGGGAEIALTQQWSLKFEYLYYDLGDNHVTANATPALPPFQVRYGWETTVHTVNAGINFKF